MILLDTTSAMETTFTLKDVIYISGLLITIVGGWFAIKMKLEKISDKLIAYDEKLKMHEEKFTASRASNKAKIAELKQDLEKRMDTFQGDNVREIMKFEDQLTKFLEKFDHYITDQQKFREDVLIKLAKK
jgi:hypothetical protein